MADLSRKTKRDLYSILANSSDEGLIDEAYDELEWRERQEELRDHTESDRDAAQSERYEMWRNEY